MNTDKIGWKILSIFLTIIISIVLPFVLTFTTTTFVVKSNVTSQEFKRNITESVVNEMFNDESSLSVVKEKVTDAFSQAGLSEKQTEDLLKDQDVQKIITDVLVSSAKNLIDENEDIKLPTVEELQGLKQQTKDVLKKFVDIDADDFGQKYQDLSKEIKDAIKDYVGEFLTQNDNQKITNQSFTDRLASSNPKEILDNTIEVLKPLSFLVSVPFELAITLLLVSLLIWANWKKKKWPGLLAISFIITSLFLLLFTVGCKVGQLALANTNYAVFTGIIERFFRSFLIAFIAYLVAAIILFVIQGIINASIKRKKKKEAKEKEKQLELDKKNNEEIIDSQFKEEELEKNDVK